LARDSASGKIVRPIAPRSSFRAVPALIAFAILASLAVIWFFMTRNAEEPARLLSFERLSDRPGEERHPSFSSDGKQFVYASLTGDQWNIYLQRTGGSAAIQLTQGLGDCMQPALSPDGAHILFRAERDGGGLYVMEPTGENPRRLTADGYYPAWAPDSRHFVYSEVNFISPSQRGVQVNLLHIADTADGSQRTLVSGDAAQPAWSPHGYRIAYWSLRAGGQRDIVTVAASGKESPLAVTNDSALDWNPVWSPSGRYLYFLSDRGGPMNVWRVRIDEQTGRTLRAPEPITVPANYVGGLSFSGVGDEFIYSNALRESTLHRLDFDLEHQTIKGAPQRVATSVHSISNFAFSPDGSELVYDTLGDSLENLWIMNVDGSGRRRLTSGPYKDRVPIWSPRGDEIVFFSDRGGPYDNWIIKPDGSGLRRLTALTNPDIQRSVWSPDGARLLAARNHGPAAFLNPEGTSPVTDPPAAAGLENVQDVLFTAWSENLIVGEIEPEVVLYEGGHLTRTGRKGHVPMIPRDPANRGSRYLLYARGGDVLLYDRTADRETKLFSVAPSRIYMLVSPPGGGSLYFTEAASDGDLWSARFLPETVPRHDPE
jgi:Tol biopolymer transport system component